MKNPTRIVEEVFDYKGFKCMIVFNDLGISRFNEIISQKWRCGYVGVKKKHLLFGKDYSKVEDLIYIHGGLTFSGDFNDKKIKKEIGNLKDIWWFGFDCNHFEDNIKKWSFNKVKKEVMELANQLNTKNLILMGLKND